MIINKVAAIPLVTCDPFFSIWSTHEKLNHGKTTHWSGKDHELNGYIKIDNEVFCFLGEPEFYPLIEQKELYITATATTAIFENSKIKLSVKFTTPALLDKIEIASRPITYVDFEIEKKDKEVLAEVIFTAKNNIVSSENDNTVGKENSLDNLNFAMMGKEVQKPLSESGDTIGINWGYLFFATANGKTCFDNNKLTANIDLSTKATLILAYDDICSVNYMGDFLKGYWTLNDKNIYGAMLNAFNEHECIMSSCSKLDKIIEEKSNDVAGEAYAFLCNMSFRHTLAAHKIVADRNGTALVLSKENASNGCIGTVDVSYPSIPMFMLFSADYLKGMVIPVLQFAKCDAWEYDFAPHDVGRYPYAWGQVYGLNEDFIKSTLPLNNAKTIYPEFHNYPKNSNLYDLKFQMPVEECGNMLIILANISLMENNSQFALEHLETLKMWTNYLIKFGSDPGNQLCTDDFAGHLPHNVNLSFKAVMGIEAFALIFKLNNQDDEYEYYHKIAKEMAKDCETRAKTGDHSKLGFDKADSWSLKYNIIWDKIWDTNLISDEFFENEINYYISKNNEYGVPLDSRADYTKSDWILWCSAFANDKKQKIDLIKPVANYLENTSSKVPFSDWYDTKTGKYIYFIGRSVQGGIFMPLLLNEIQKVEDKNDNEKSQRFDFRKITS